MGLMFTTQKGLISPSHNDSKVSASTLILACLPLSWAVSCSCSSSWCAQTGGQAQSPLFLVSWILLGSQVVIRSLS